MYSGFQKETIRGTMGGRKEEEERGSLPGVPEKENFDTIKYRSYIKYGYFLK